jgi:transcriptional regulator with XRE-family HTH domain
VTNIKPGLADAATTKKRPGRRALEPRALEAAERLRQARMRLRLSVAEVAFKIGVAPHKYRFLEKKFGPAAEAAYLPALAAALMVDPEWLSHGSGQPPPPLPLPRQSLKSGERIQFAARARSRRQERGLSSLALASLIGISESTLMKWESALRPVRQPAEAHWEAALGVPNGWLRNMTEGAPAIAEAPSTHAGIAPAATVAEEIRRISCWLITRGVERRTANDDDLDPSERRAVEVMALRYGLHGESKSTLQSIGTQFGLTRERVRQIIARNTERARHWPVATPCLDRLSDEIKKLLPSTVAELDQHLKDALGESLSVMGAERFARDVLGRSIACLTNTPANMAAPWEMVASSGDDAETIREVRAAAFGMIRSCGAAHIGFISSAAGQLLNRALSTMETVRCCRLIGKFEWLREQDGWFWFGPDRENRLLSITSKVLSVANRNVDVEEIYGALVRSRRSRYQTDRPRPYLVDPPPALIIEVLKRIPTIRQVQHDDFRLKNPVSPEDVLSDTELAIYRVLSQRGGIATRQTLYKELVDTGTLLATALQAPLESSPILMRLDHGLYALRGTELSPQSWAQSSANALAAGAVPTAPCSTEGPDKR